MSRFVTTGLVAVAATLVSACGYECAYDIDATQRAPDGRFDVVTYTKSCGAMMGARYGVSLVDAGKRLTESSDIRVLYYQDPANGAGRPVATWNADGSLMIGYDTTSTVITQLAVVARIPVSYRTEQDTSSP